MSPSQSPPSSRFKILGVVLLLVLHGGLCLHTASLKTITHDEIWHLPIGLANLQRGDFSVERVNPPLTRMWSALPLYFGGVQGMPEGASVSERSERFVETIPWQRWYVAGRAMNIVWSILLGLVVYGWSRQLFGVWGGMLSLLLYAASPNMIGHASVVTPDMGHACGFVATLFAASHCGARSNVRSTVLLSLIFGLTLWAKYTALTLVPLVLLAMLAARTREQKPARLLLCYVVVCVGALFVLNAGMLFHGSLRTLADFQFQSATFQSLQTWPVISQLPIPLPEDYLLGIDEQKHVMSLPHPSFLDGEWRVEGFRDYFYRAILYKVPVFALAASFVGGILCLLKTREQRAIAALIVLLVPCLVLTGIANQTSLQLGIRYVLPCLALLAILAGRVGQWVEGALERSGDRRLRIGVSVAATLLALLPLTNHPHHLAYFNTIAGGPSLGRYHLLDSNLDWGQDLYLVKQYIEEHDIDDVHLAYFGTFPPHLMGFDYSLPSSWAPSPGWHFVSVNYAMGRPHVLHRHDGTLYGTDFGEFLYFSAFKPVASLGNSIDIYHIRPEDLERSR